MLPTGGGDRQIAAGSADNLGTAVSRKLSAPICVICGFFRCAGVRPLCLRVFVFAMSSVFLSVFSVPLWFIAWVGGLPVVF